MPKGVKGFQRTWTEEQLGKAIISNDSWLGVTKALGLMNSKPKEFKQYADEYGFDYSHFNSSAGTIRALRKRRTWSDEQLEKAIKQSFAWTEVHVALNLKAGGNAQRLRLIADDLGYDYSHFDPKAVMSLASRTKRKASPSLESLLVKGEARKTHLKRRLLLAGLLENKCFICDLVEWLGEPITLHLDHINGDATDNRLENLRILCPNCHQQTPTWGGRNNQYREGINFNDRVGMSTSPKS